MTQYSNGFFERHWRSAVLVCMSVAGLCMARAGHAATRAELYQASAPVTDRSEAAQTAAFQAAMKIVLIRVTGRRSADEDAALAPLVANARRYVQQYRAASDNQLGVSFDGPAIERWLTQNGQPVWGQDRPTTVVWLAAQAGAHPGAVITGEDTSDLKLAIDAAASLRGVPLVWPSAADVQRNHLDYASLGGGGGALSELGRRLGGDAVLIGRATDTSATAGVRWTHIFQDRSSEYSGTVEGINRTADLYAELFSASGNLAPVDIEVTGVGDLREYAYLENYLESQTFISHVSVLGLSGNVITFRLAMRGGAESLQRALSLNGRLQPVAGGDGGVQRFELRR